MDSEGEHLSETGNSISIGKEAVSVFLSPRKQARSNVTDPPRSAPRSIGRTLEEVVDPRPKASLPTFVGPVCSPFIELHIIFPDNQTR
jgi:hypothetical protein